MNRSIVITRYALALVKYCRETGQGEVVCSEAEALEKALHTVPELRRMVTAADDVVSPFDKKKLLQTALGNRMSPELSRFLTLLNKNGRMNLVEDILRDFVTIYRRGIGIRKAPTWSRPPNPPNACCSASKPWSNRRQGTMSSLKWKWIRPSSEASSLT